MTEGEFLSLILQVCLMFFKHPDLLLCIIKHKLLFNWGGKAGEGGFYI